MRLILFQGVLESLYLLRDVCSAVASVGHFCNISLDQENVTFQANGKQESFQIWAILSLRRMFRSHDLTDTVNIELRVDGLLQALRSYTNVHEAEMCIEQRPANVLVVSIRGENNAGRSNEMNIRQKLLASTLNEMPSVPSIGLSYYVAPSATQVAEMLEVCDRYRLLNPVVSLKVRAATLTVSAKDESVVVNTSWTVDVPEILSQPTSDNGEWLTSTSMSELRCDVAARDWVNVLQVLKSRRCAIGISHEQAVAVHCYLDIGLSNGAAAESSDSERVITFYLGQINRDDVGVVI